VSDPTQTADTPWDINKLVGTIIDAYTLASNDDERRGAVKGAVMRAYS
jgi:hypothetical protein